MDKRWGDMDVEAKVERLNENLVDLRLSLANYATKVANTQLELINRIAELERAFKAMSGQ
jgi:ribosomal protein L29